MDDFTILVLHLAGFAERVELQRLALLGKLHEIEKLEIDVEDVVDVMETVTGAALDLSYDARKLVTAAETLGARLRQTTA